MREVLEGAVRAAIARGAEYADARAVSVETDTCAVRDGHIDELGSSETAGVAVRVLWNGAWGFAALASQERSAVELATTRALEVARASAATVRRRVRLAPVEPVIASWRTQVVEDPASLPLEDRIRPLVDASDAARSVAGVATAGGSLETGRRRSTFVSSDGAAIDQDVVHTGVSFAVTARNADGVQRRSFPAPHATAGFESVRALDLPANAERIAREAVELLTAPPCPTTTTTLILAPDLVTSQVHESVGHPTELDRILGREEDFAGGSFVRLEDVGSLRYAAPIVSIVADATVPAGPGSFAFDEDGVPARRVDLVRDGILVGLQTDRATAGELGIASSGGSRSEGWYGVPMVRMTNINLVPGEGTLEELIADTRDGILMSTTASWSIDSLRTNFQFGAQIAWQIRNGRIVGPYRDAVYTGQTLPFWRSCDAVAGPAEVRTVSGSCGKGQPDQVVRTGHSAPPARFRSVAVRRS